MTAAELAEKLEGYATTDHALATCAAETLRQAAALISAQAAEIARLEEAAGEVWDEAYAEGAADTAGWEKETSHAVLQWLDKNGDGFDIHHPDGNTTDAIIQGLYDAKRAGNLTELRQAAARLRSMEEALKEAHEAINLAMTIAQGRFPATARKAPLEVLADAERKARAALAGAVRTSRKTLSGEGQ